MRKTSLYRQPLGNPMPIAELITPNQARLLPQSTGNGNAAENLVDYGWYKGNSGNRVHAGGEKLPNGFGLYDMHGNVSEYCLDASDSKCGLTDAQLASRIAIVDPCGVWTGVSGGSFRMLRGGNYANDAALCRSGFRYESMHPDAGSTAYGARLVCPLPRAQFPAPVNPNP